jgi:hypothetical protein
MLRSSLAAGVVAGGLFAFSGTMTQAAPVGLKAAAPADSSAVVQVRRGFHGGHGFHGFRGHAFRGHGFRGHAFRGGSWGHRGFRRWGGGGWGRGWGHRRHHGRFFLYGALPFLGWGAYNYGYGYGYGGCGWLRHRYYVTGSWYWYRRWRACRGWY